MPTALFAERTGYPLSLVATGVDAATRRGLLEPAPTRLAPTELGRRFLNDLQTLFLNSPMNSPARTRNAPEVAPLVRIEATGIER